MLFEPYIGFHILVPERAILVPLFIRLMTPYGEIWSRDQRTVTMRRLSDPCMGQ